MRFGQKEGKFFTSAINSLLYITENDQSGTGYSVLKKGKVYILCTGHGYQRIKVD